MSLYSFETRRYLDGDRDTMQWTDYLAGILEIHVQAFGLFERSFEIDLSQTMGSQQTIRSRGQRQRDIPIEKLLGNSRSMSERANGPQSRDLSRLDDVGQFSDGLPSNVEFFGAEPAFIGADIGDVVYLPTGELVFRYEPL